MKQLARLAFLTLGAAAVLAGDGEKKEEPKPKKPPEKKPEEKPEKKPEEGEKGKKGKRDGKKVPDKARIVFVTKVKPSKKGEKATELVWIRLTPLQYRSAKGRARIRRRGLVRILLGPRQLAELNTILKREDKAKDDAKRPLKKIALRVRAKRLRTRRGIKAHYVVRPLSLFAKPAKGNVIEEPDEKRRGR